MKCFKVLRHKLHSLVCIAGNVDSTCLASALCSAGYVDIVAEQTVAWHALTNYTSHDLASVNANADLVTSHHSRNIGEEKTEASIKGFRTKVTRNV